MNHFRVPFAWFAGKFFGLWVSRIGFSVAARFAGAFVKGAVAFRKTMPLRDGIKPPSLQSRWLLTIRRRRIRFPYKTFFILDAEISAAAARFAAAVDYRCVFNQDIH